jgi:hypothetical protein
MSNDLKAPAALFPPPVGKEVLACKFLTSNKFCVIKRKNFAGLFIEKSDIY